MLVPPPPPPYTLSPDLDDMTPEDLLAVERALSTLTGHFDGVVVVAIAQAAGVRVIELATEDGQVMLLDSSEALLPD
jgi:hypothetical protein